LRTACAVFCLLQLQLADLKLCTRLGKLALQVLHVKLGEHIARFHAVARLEGYACHAAWHLEG
jgi:hypothetical protein